jgi:hypothetical protein
MFHLARVAKRERENLVSLNVISIFFFSHI